MSKNKTIKNHYILQLAEGIRLGSTSLDFKLFHSSLVDLGYPADAKILHFGKLETGYQKQSITIANGKAIEINVPPYYSPSDHQLLDTGWHYVVISAERGMFFREQRSPLPIINQHELERWLVQLKFKRPSSS